MTGKTKRAIDSVVETALRTPGITIWIIIPGSHKGEMRVDLPNGSDIRVKAAPSGFQNGSKILFATAGSGVFSR